MSSILAVVLEYKGTQDESEVHDEEMALLDDDEIEISFEDDEEGKQFKTGFAENMMINNAPEDLKQKLKHSKNASNA